MRDAVAKHMNFGLAGGMGALKFVSWVRNASDLRLRVDESVEYQGRTVPSAKELKRRWLQTWSVMRRYFKVMAAVCSETGPKKITQFGSERVRGQLRFTEACNAMFQGYVADVAKTTLYLVSRACYVDRSSPLYGTRPVLFIHDEIILDCPEEQGHDAAMELQRIMEGVQAEWMPDVPALAEPLLTRRWSKKAKRIVDRHGRLVPWEWKT